MRFQVCCESCPLDKVLATLVTLVGADVLVFGQMLEVGTSLDEGFRAKVAAVGTDVGVNFEVSLEAWFVGEVLAAYVAQEGFCPGVDPFVVD